MAFTDYGYIPILRVRPAEMRAMEELASQAKDAMLPYVVLQPWLAANELASVIARVDASVGGRPIIADIGEPASIGGRRRPVHDAFDLLRESNNGFENYVAFIRENESYIPSVQLADLAQIDRQVEHLAQLNRGVAVRLHEPMMVYAGDIAGRVARRFADRNVHFILDFEKQNREILLKAAIAVSCISAIRRVLPSASVSVGASTFPDSFVGLEHQDIFERQFFNVVDEAIGSENIIYCDRGSARAEELGGGGGAPAPRIDLANISRWNFFRIDDADDKVEGFRRAANNAIAAPCWQDHGIWGTEYIKRTADENEADIIDTASKCTAARINIHLHVQALNGSESAGTGEETGWSD